MNGAGIGEARPKYWDWLVKAKPVIVFGLYYYCWILCAQAGASGEWRNALFITAASLGIFVAFHPKPAVFLGYGILFTAIGSVGDGLLGWLGFYQLASGELLLVWPPVWFLAFWALFAAVVPFSFTWLRGRYVLAAILGGSFAPLSYYAGVKMEAIALGEDWVVYYFLVGFEWLLVFPLTLLVCEKLKLFVVVEPVVEQESTSVSIESPLMTEEA